MSTSSASTPDDDGVLPIEPRYTLAVPETWPHKNAPLHALLQFQNGKCGVCFADVQWSSTEAGAETVAYNDLRQWVKDDLLLGLVCYTCARRYKDLGVPPVGEAALGLPAFLADPPGQRCRATVGLGRQVRPRYFDSSVRPTETPSPETWTYTNTVVHALFLYQRGRCAICSTGLPVVTEPKSVHVDHDDATGLIRGLLCRRCNTCLGQKLPKTWWEHLAPMADAYLKHPPAQIFPATRGLTMGQRTRPAQISRSADQQEVLLGGMPMSIATPCPADSEPRTKGWYAVRYEASAPVGLPPVLEADHCFTYVDDDGNWLTWVMDPPSGASRRESHCILRVALSDVVDVTRHATLPDAVGALAA